MKKLTGIRRRWVKNSVSIMIVLVICCVMITSLAFTLYYSSNMRSQLESRAKTTANFFANYINQGYKEFYQSCITFAETYEDKDSMELQFINTRGTIVASSYGHWAGPSPSTSDITEALTTKTLSYFLGKNPQTGELIMAVSNPMIYSNGEVIGVLRYVTSMRLAVQQIILILVVTIAIGLLAIWLVLFSSKYFLRSILEPVSEITATAKRIAAGSYGVQIKTKYNDEISELAETINDMSDKISQSDKMKTEFMSSLSHELRTPLTAITGWSETLLGDENLDNDTRRGLSIIHGEARRLTEMVMDLLEFTRMQDGRFTLNVAVSDVKSDFEDTIFIYGKRLRQEGISLEYLENDHEIPDIPCDCKRLRQVYLNILDNAAKHAASGKKIDASISRENDMVVIRFRDYGPGIPEEEIPHVKMRFYKGSSKVRGSGIGLAVCDEIVQMHNGTLTLENAQGGGALVTIRLPISQS